MPSLKKMLKSYDLDLIERIRSFWELDATHQDPASAVETLASAMQDQALVKEVIESLPTTAREALSYLVTNPKQVTWSQFIRKYGEIREFGPAKREREEPEQHPVSVSEILWYHGLIGRAFMNLPPEPREYAYIPDELLSSIRHENSQSSQYSLEAVADNKVNRTFPSDSRLIDHMIDWLAARRMGRSLPESAWQYWRENEPFLKHIAAEGGLINAQGMPDTEVLPRFFQQDRHEILEGWLTIWRNSTAINDLRNLPGLICEGEWQNDPVRPRQLLLEIMAELQPETWYSLKALIDSIKNDRPDFQRSAGDYDRWFIRQSTGDEPLRGFEHWDDVEGALIKLLVTGPLHWLGMLDIGLGEKKNKELFFKKTTLFNSYLRDEKHPAWAAKESPIKILPELKFSIPNFASRTLRYQIGRFCEVESLSASETCYEITARSMRQAQEGGLKASQLIGYLEKHLLSSLPKPLLLMAEQWDQSGLTVSVEPFTLLRSPSTKIVQALQMDPKTAKYVLEVLNPNTLAINPAGIKTIISVLKEKGHLSEVRLEV